MQSFKYFQEELFIEIYKTYVKFYKQQTDYYNQAVYNILQNEIGLILPSFNSNSNNRKKRYLIIFWEQLHQK